MKKKSKILTSAIISALVLCGQFSFSMLNSTATAANNRDGNNGFIRRSADTSAPSLG